MSGTNQEGDWEGFEGSTEVLEPHNHFYALPQLTRSKTTPSEPPKPIQPQKTVTKHRISPVKKRCSLQPRLRSQPAVSLQPQPISPPKQSVQSTTANYLHRKVQAKTYSEWGRGELKRYQRIPIARFEEDTNRGGRVVYRGFVPRTSDHLLRTLKEVRWSGGEGREDGGGRAVGGGVQFNSQFEGGNLAFALQRVGECEYDLYMRVDTNTRGHRQWFYFSMKNHQKCKVKLHIHRFKKPFSLFQRGMRPYIRSRKTDSDWQPGGTQVLYHYEHERNQYGVKKSLKTSVLTFKYTFKAENDQVFVAAGVPYTYSFLQKQIETSRQMASRRENLSFEVSTLCKTLCGLPVQLLTIEHKMSRLIHDNNQKKFIVINARTHPGETSSSWVLDGILEGVSKPEIEEVLLQENLCLKIVPMLNPDGVFMGNYRTGVLGEDLNRRFAGSRKDLYPEIYALKQMVHNCRKEGQVEMFLDLHGHSVLRNSFIYGPNLEAFNSSKMHSLPYHLFHNTSMFRIESCRFNFDDSKADTARRFFQLKQQILSMTCQNSLGLLRVDRSRNTQLMPCDWQKFGVQILGGIVDILKDKKVAIPTVIKTSPRKKRGAKPSQLCLKEEIERKLGIGANSLIEEAANKYRFKAAASELKSRMLGCGRTRPTDTCSSKDKMATEGVEGEDAKVAFKIRRKLGTCKKSLIACYGKEEPLSAKGRFKEEDDGVQLIRAATHSHPESLKEEIEKMKRKEEEREEEYEVESIQENFSQDYDSVDDKDSSDEDLPESEKKVLFEYIRSVQGMKAEEDEPVRVAENRTVKSLSRQARVSAFREIRFESIELEDSIKEKVQARMAKRIKLQPHKFKDFHRLERGPQAGMVPISQQKRLNQRQQQWKRGQSNDPFVLVQRRSQERSGRLKLAFA